jgi:hypothetical protein
MVEYLENLRKNLAMIQGSQLTDKRSNSIKNLRKSFISARDSISKLDHSLYLIHLIDSILSISTIMLHIYLFAIGLSDPIIKSLSSALIFVTFLCVTKFLIDSIIHGMVYEEVDKIYLFFDKMDISVYSMDENTYREVLYFKAQTSDSKFGFTIAGLVPFKKITLLSVSFLFYINFNSFLLKNKRKFFILIDILLYSQLYCNISSKRKNVKKIIFTLTKIHLSKKVNYH